MADVGHLPDVAARLRADVLPLSAGGLVVLLDRATAASRRRPCRGSRRPAPSGRNRPGGCGKARNAPARPDPDPGAASDCRDLRRACHRSHRAATGHARGHYVCPAHCADVDRYAGIDFARPHRAHLHVHADRRAHGIGCAQAVHGAGKLRDHGDPVLHPGRKFSHPRRRRAPHDRFRDRHGRALVWRLGASGGSRLRAVCRGVWIVPRDGGRNRLRHPAGDGGARLPETVRRRRHHHVRLARDFDTAVYSDGALRRRHQFIGRKTVHRRHCPRHRAGDDAGRDDLLSRLAQQLSAYAPGIVRRTRAHVPRIRSGACS